MEKKWKNALGLRVQWNFEKQKWRIRDLLQHKTIIEFSDVSQIKKGR